MFLKYQELQEKRWNATSVGDFVRGLSRRLSLDNKESLNAMRSIPKDQWNFGLFDLTKYLVNDEKQRRLDGKVCNIEDYVKAIPAHFLVNTAILFNNGYSHAFANVGDESYSASYVPFREMVQGIHDKSRKDRLDKVR